LSDANGFAKTTVISGTTTGTVNVTATARIGATVLSAASGSIPIVGRTPSRNAFTVRCDFKNMAGLVGVDPGNIETFISEPIACAGTLLDRFSNPVGEASSLTFLVEGGQPPGTTQSVPWDTGVTDTPPANTGTYAFTYNPLGNIPCDVDPDFDSDEPYLFFDEDECSAIQQNCPDREEPDCSRNPRDGLVSIVASTNGEEAFSDLNSNGTYDEGEPFWDIGEPFVDVNDNNEFDLGELFRDFESGEDPPNGEYDGPNGVWDNNLTIWTTTHVLLTGLPEVQESEIDGEPLLSSGFVFDVADREEPIRGVHEVNGGLVTLGSLWQDKNLNVLNRSNSYDVTVLGDTSGVTVTPITSESPDLGLGFRLIYGDQLEEDVRSTYRTRVRDLDSPPFAFIADVEYAFAEGETEKLVRLEFTAEVNVVPGGGDSFIITRVVSVLFQNQQ
jgi:hypothetical protein